MGVGKAAATKDLAYCCVCAAGFLTFQDEESYLRAYHTRLVAILEKQGDVPPRFEQLFESYQLSMCDLARWMAGCVYGWWGHAHVLRRHAEVVLQALDGGV